MILCNMKKTLESTFLTRITCAVTILILLFAPVTTFAQDAEAGTSEPLFEVFPEPALEPEAEPDIQVPGMGPVNATHRYLSTTVEKLSQRIDTFFGEKRAYEEATGTYLQARGSLIYSEGGEFDFDGKFRAKVDLPQLREKVHLVIETDNESDNIEDFNRITTGTGIVDNLQYRDVSAAVQFMLKEKKRWDFSVRPGLKLTNPIETFIKLRLRRNQPLGEKWLSRGAIEVGYYSDHGWENEYELGFERYIGSYNFFSATSNVLWRDDHPGMQFLWQRFQITHFLDRNSLIAFEIGMSAENRPNLIATSYFSNVRYRRNIHRGWLFFEIKPQVIAYRDNRFEPEPSLVLSLEVLFGAQQLDKVAQSANGGS